MRSLSLVLLLSGPALFGTALFGTAGAAPVKITFWHSMESVSGLVQQYADAFNKSQNLYEVVPQSAGNYLQAEDRLEAALKDGTAPTMFQAELTFFPKLAADGQLANLGSLTNKLAPEFVKDFYPAVWGGGELDGKRFGLPWNVSTPALFYNASALGRAGLTPPKTLGELETAAKKLSGRGKRGLLAVADAWTFESLVASLGGSVVKGGAPNFTSPQAVSALDLLARMSKDGSAAGRTLSEAPRAAFDFVRGVHSLAFASVANWPDFQKLAVFFGLGAAPMPCAQKCAVTIGGAELVVLSNATREQQSGAVAFWQYLTRPEVLADWVRRTYYLPPRKSVQPLLRDFFAENRQRAPVFAQLDHALPRPKAPQYARWRVFLEEAIARATKDGVPAREALEDAQRKALGGS